MFRENQSRKAVSLTDLRSGSDQSSATVSESGQQSSYVDMYDGIGHSSQPQSTTVINVVGGTPYDPNGSWISHRSEDDSGIDTPSFHFENRRLHFLSGLRERRRITYGDRGHSFKLHRGKIEKKVPYILGPSRRKSCNEIHLPSIHRGLTRYTKAIRKGNCIYVGKAASLALENGDYDDFMSVPSSSSSTSDSPSYVVTSPPRCTLSFNPLTRRRHSLYAKVYSGGHRIASVAEEDAPRSVVEGLDLNRSASCVENGNHAALVPSGSLSVDLSTPQFESTLNRFNSLCITLKSGQMGFQRPAEYNSTTDSLCTQFSTMMLPTSHSTGHSPFSSPHPIENNILSWTTQPSQSAQDLLTPNASEHQPATFFTPNTSTSSTFFATCLRN
uniref:Uncharacterized protein n=1 Tax=Panagrolaimus sp. ES5 TaxID=591445 RepID=A0AC34GV97_9BILA